MANGSQNGVSRVLHHSEYYLKDGNITFLVENTLFRVHRHFFERESQFFIEEFTKAPQEGTSDTSAFRLDKITSADFAKLLWVWYSPMYRRFGKPKDHWLVILELSTRWLFPEMKQLAIDELQNLEMDPVEKIVTYDKYQVDKSLLVPAYKLLCKRTNRMSNEEGEQLKMPTVLGLQEVRERAIRSAAESGCTSPTSADAEDGVLEKILNEVFNLNTTNRQAAKSQGQPIIVPIINTPKPDANGATNKSFIASTLNDHKQPKEAEKQRNGKGK